jgi:hypothetical protein
MVSKQVRSVVLGAFIAGGSLATAYGAPMTPSAMMQPTSPPDLVSFWGLPFPFGFTYQPGQCYIWQTVETPRGPVVRRVWVCTERAGRGYDDGGRF